MQSNTDIKCSSYRSFVSLVWIDCLCLFSFGYLKGLWNIYVAVQWHKQDRNRQQKIEHL